MKHWFQHSILLCFFHLWSMNELFVRLNEFRNMKFIVFFLITYKYAHTQHSSEKERAEGKRDVSKSANELRMANCISSYCYCNNYIDWDHLPLACKVLFATGGTIIAWFTCCLFDDFLVTVIVDRFSEMGDVDTDVVVVVVVLFGVNRLSENLKNKTAK